MLAEGIGKATGKIILMGEHSVVYGEPAIAFPFSGTQVVATVKKSSVPSLCST
jgi:mevalonate kinase